MGYTDAQGRPEIVMNDSIKCGDADYRIVETEDTAAPPVPPRREPSPVRRRAAELLRQRKIDEATNHNS